jgi:hypothetical protein
MVSARSPRSVDSASHPAGTAPGAGVAPRSSPWSARIVEVVEYLRALWRWRTLVTGFFAAVLGVVAILALPGISAAGLFALVFLSVMLLVAPFFAWRDMRGERDAGREQVNDLDEQMRQRDERGDVRLRFIHTFPEGVYKLVIQVWNDGPTSTFSASIVTAIDGVWPAGYGLFNKIAWEGSLDRDVRIATGQMDYLFLCTFDAGRGRFRFIGPASAYTQGAAQTAGMELSYNGTPVEFDIEVLDTEVSVPVRQRVRIDFGPGANLPILALGEVPQEPQRPPD